MGIIVILFWLYFLAYILMGFFQPIDAISRLISSRKINNEYTSGIKKYLLSVLAYFLILIGMYTIDFQIIIDGFVAFYLLILPWGLSIWYIIHIRLWNDKKENKTKSKPEEMLFI